MTGKLAGDPVAAMSAAQHEARARTAIEVVGRSRRYHAAVADVLVAEVQSGLDHPAVRGRRWHALVAQLIREGFPL